MTFWVLLIEVDNDMGHGDYSFNKYLPRTSLPIWQCWRYRNTLVNKLARLLFSRACFRIREDRQQIDIRISYAVEKRNRAVGEEVYMWEECFSLGSLRGHQWSKAWLDAELLDENPEEGRAMARAQREAETKALR